MRYKEIDIFKGILVIFMVYAHCIQFFILRAGRGDAVAYLLSDYINLTTFSGFMFSFGFVCWHAYINKAHVYKRLGVNIAKTLAAFYISSFAYFIFIASISADRFPWLDLLLVRRLAGWSEFILSFAAVMLLVLVFHKLMQKAGRYLPFIIVAVAVVATLLPLRVSDPLIATFIGRPPFATFPVLPYGIFFAGGLWVAQHGVRFSKILLAICIAGLLYFAGHLFISGGLPSRFPVSLAWMAGSMLFVYLYYLLSFCLSETKIGGVLQNIGSNSLFYLLMSNIFIFAVTGVSFPMATHAFTAIVFIIFMAIMYYLTSLSVRRIDKKA